MEEEFRTERMLFGMKRISLCLTAHMEACLREPDISGVQVYLIVYILRHHPEGTYLTELCREIGLSKPTLSVMIRKLVEKGYLAFQENPGDIRKKSVLPTAKLQEKSKRFLEETDQMEAKVCSALSQQEKDQLWRLEEKLLKRLAELERETKMKKDRRLLKREKSIASAQTV